MPGGGGGKGGFNFPDPWDFNVASNSVVRSNSDITSDSDVRTNSDITSTANLTSTSNLTTETVLKGDAGQPITLKLEPVAFSATLKGDPKAPIATTSSIEFLNWPRLDFDQLITLVKTVTQPKLRINFPVGLNFAVSFFPLNALGYDAITFSVCGEQQIITQEFVPNRFERCDIGCEPLECEPIDCELIDCEPSDCASD